VQEKDSISELYKDTFSNYEVPVRPELWQEVASKIQAPAAPGVPDVASVAKISSAASKISGTAIAWIGTAAVVITVATGYYFYNNSAPSPIQNNSSEITTSNESSELPAVSNGVLLNAETSEISAQLLPNPGKNNEKTSSEKSSSQTATSQVIETAGASDKVEIKNGQDKTEINTITSAPATESANVARNSSNTNVIPASENPFIKNKIQANPSTGYAPLTVNFSTTLAGETTDWLFGEAGNSIKGSQVAHTFNTPGTYLVTVKHTTESGKVYTELVKIEVLSDLTITNIPNIFTPNGDGSNDVFKVVTDKDIDIEVSIFDKTGKFIHKFSGVENSWNGKINNLQDAGEGTYFYVIFATGQKGAQNTQKGTITLKR